jgi:hypothetical protein
MMIAVVNNLPELFLGTAWTGLSLYFGMRFGMWRAQRD